MAIELVACNARTPSDPAVLLSQLAESKDFAFLASLVGKGRNARKGILKATFLWSYDRLSEEQQILFRRLSVFEAGWTLEAAESVCGFDPIRIGDVAGLLTGLMERSVIMLTRSDGLVSTVDGGVAEQRYHILEPFRRFGLNFCEEHAELGSLFASHREFFRNFSERADPHLRTSEQSTWLDLIEADRANIHAALTRGSIGDSGELEDKLALAASLHRYWVTRNDAVGRIILDDLLEAEGLVSPVVRAKALHSGANFDRTAAAAARNRGIEDKATRLLRRSFERETECLTIARQTGDTSLAAMSLNNLGLIRKEAGDREGALRFLNESLQIRRDIGSLRLVAGTLNEIGTIHIETGDLSVARTCLEESHSILRGTHPWGEATVLGQLGELCLAEGDRYRGVCHFAGSLKLYHGLGDRWRTVKLLERIAEIGIGGNEGGMSKAAGEAASAIRKLLELGPRRDTNALPLEVEAVLQRALSALGVPR